MQALDVLREIAFLQITAYPLGTEGVEHIHERQLKKVGAELALRLEETFRLMGIDTNTATADKVVFLGQLEMVGYEMLVEYDIAVNLYDVRMGDFHDGLVEDFRLAEASVLVPHMNDGYVCFLAQLFDHLTRIVARTVVRNDNLGRLDCLTEYTTDTKSQRIFPVIRRD